MNISRGILILAVVSSLLFYEWTTIYPTTTSLQARAADSTLALDRELPNNPFTQDGCSLFPNKLLWHDFRPACLTHDIAYWAGGASYDRAAADVLLYSDVRSTGPLGPVFAPIMYWGVSTFGDSWITKLVGANWGYGNNESS